MQLHQRSLTVKSSGPQLGENGTVPQIMDIKHRGLELAEAEIVHIDVLAAVVMCTFSD